MSRIGKRARSRSRPASPSTRSTAALRVKGPKGTLAEQLPARDRRARSRAARCVFRARGRRAADARAARPRARAGRQHGPGRGDAVRARARDPGRRLPRGGVGQEAHAAARLLASDRDRGARGLRSRSTRNVIIRIEGIDRQPRRPVRGEPARAAPAGAVQGQGHPLRRTSASAARSARPAAGGLRTTHEAQDPRPKPSASGARASAQSRRRVARSDARARSPCSAARKHIYAQLIDSDDRPHARRASRRARRRSSATAHRPATSRRPRRWARRSPSSRARTQIEEVVFNRNGFLYHGRVKALADAAREAGLQF